MNVIASLFGDFLQSITNKDTICFPKFFDAPEDKWIKHIDYVVAETDAHSITNLGNLLIFTDYWFFFNQKSRHLIYQYKVDHVLEASHLCSNASCIDPFHLLIESRQANLSRIRLLQFYSNKTHEKQHKLELFLLRLFSSPFDKITRLLIRKSNANDLFINGLSLSVKTEMLRKPKFISLEEAIDAALEEEELQQTHRPQQQREAIESEQDDERRAPTQQPRIIQQEPHKEKRGEPQPPATPRPNIPIAMKAETATPNTGGQETTTTELLTTSQVR
ncbi:hypothetical protein M3Y98_00347100 [Aphelenchoides besseyi]|nr:hypothetical protein M3Y98_00347100 [Aphelenchoides besseyi]